MFLKIAIFLKISVKPRPNSLYKFAKSLDFSVLPSVSHHLSPYLFFLHTFDIYSVRVHMVLSLKSANDIHFSSIHISFLQGSFYFSFNLCTIVSLRMNFQNRQLVEFVHFLYIFADLCVFLANYGICTFF